MSINYNILAKDYDLTRTANTDIINRMVSELSLDGKVILDFGCGTGNFISALKKQVAVCIYGIEPSEGMREKALAKGLDVRYGNHSYIPFNDNFFDFVYMTFVIHHVSDLEIMFLEVKRVLKPGGFICILTHSHNQIETSFWGKFFPTSIQTQKERYPDIPRIIQASNTVGLKECKTDTINKKFILSEKHIKLVENKGGYSIFSLISDADYKAGLEAIKREFYRNTFVQNTHGNTLVWLKKEI